MPKKKFIDKKNAVTFHLVHRSQQDPLAADEKAPQRVLLPVSDAKLKRKDEQRKFGIFFDDDYNYLQHLKESNKELEWVPIASTHKQIVQQTANVEKNVEELMENEDAVEVSFKLPSSVFASTVEEDIGLLNKAAPTGLRLDVDPDIVAAMDEDFDFNDPDNVLEDNFMQLANASGEKDYSDRSSNFDDEEIDEIASLEGGQFTFKDEETKSRFTNYSMTSSVIHRNDQLTLLDDRFEKMYEEYDENEIGALDCDEIEGFLPDSSDILLQYAVEFEQQQKTQKLDDANAALRAKLSQMVGSSDEDDQVKIEVKPKEQWDCESILSTYSNLYNHPKLISEPKKAPKIKLNRKGIAVIETNRLTAKALHKLDETVGLGTSSRASQSVGAQTVLSTLSMLSIRPKDETPEGRRERKKQVRFYRHERRVEKKCNSVAFKEEAKRQIKINMNNKNNIQGNRIL